MKTLHTPQGKVCNAGTTSVDALALKDFLMTFKIFGGGILVAAVALILEIIFRIIARVYRSVEQVENWEKWQNVQNVDPALRTFLRNNFMQGTEVMSSSPKSKQFNKRSPPSTDNVKHQINYYFKLESRASDELPLYLYKYKNQN